MVCSGFSLGVRVGWRQSEGQVPKRPQRRAVLLRRDVAAGQAASHPACPWHCLAAGSAAGCSAGIATF